MRNTAKKWIVETDWLAEHLDAPDLIVFDGSWHLPTAKRDAKADAVRFPSEMPTLGSCVNRQFCSVAVSSDALVGISGIRATPRWTIAGPRKAGLGGASRCLWIAPPASVSLTKDGDRAAP